jgi:hypothetical protein
MFKIKTNCFQYSSITQPDRDKIALILSSPDPLLSRKDVVSRFRVNLVIMRFNPKTRISLVKYILKERDYGSF